MVEIMVAVTLIAAAVAVTMAISATRSRRRAERLRDEWLALREAEWQEVLREYAERIQPRE